MKPVIKSSLDSADSHIEPIHKMLELFDDLLKHDGFGEFRVEVKILKRKQKEVIIHSGKQFRFVVDVSNGDAINPKAGGAGLRQDT